MQHLRYFFIPHSNTVAYFWRLISDFKPPFFLLAIFPRVIQFVCIPVSLQVTFGSRGLAFNATEPQSQFCEWIHSLLASGYEDGQGGAVGTGKNE